MALIALVGGVGVGKTFFGKHFIENYPSITLVEEDVTQNLFLDEFYQDMKKWGFHSRISMLSMILNQTLPYYNQSNIIMIDRCVNELIVFATKEFEENNMTQKEFVLYKQLFNSIVQFLPKPDLYIFFDCSTNTAYERIKLRGRECEKSITISFCEDVLVRYREWRKTLDSGSVIDINTDNPIDYEKIYQRILTTLQEKNHAN